MVEEIKELGVKVAVSKEEEALINLKKEAEQLIRMSEQNIFIQKLVLEAAENKLKDFSK